MWHHSVGDFLIEGSQNGKGCQGRGFFPPSGGAPFCLEYDVIQDIREWENPDLVGVEPREKGWNEKTPLGI